MGKSVPALLRSMTSRELSEWQAYERHEGPISARYSHELQAQTVELLQVLIRALTNSGNGEPFPFRPVDRPWWRPQQEDETEDEYDARIAREQAEMMRGRG